MPTPIPAVAYYRMSDDRQETSIPDQRVEVQAYAAKHGYRILREYQDEGISGDATDKRLSFQQMLRDAKERGDFQVVLCWDQDRFGRFDPLEAGYWIQPLRTAGVRLETVAQGRIDWEDFAGRIIYAVQQEGKHAFLRDLSRNVVRGQLAAVKQGKWMGGPAPYGYAMADGRLVLGDPDKVEVVGWLFRTYARGEASIGRLSEELNRRGVPSPGGGLWYDNSVHKVLQRPTYTGDTVWNRRHDGKYFGVTDGAVAPKKRGKGPRAIPPDQWVTIPGTHPALVDHETFEQVQQRLRENQTRTTPVKGGGDFLFSRLLFCGNCGSPMHGSAKHSTVDKKCVRRRRYICGHYNQFGRRACSCNTVVEDVLLSAIIQKLQAWFTDERNLTALRSEIRRQLEEKASPRTDERNLLETRAAELDKQIAQGTERLLTAPADLMDLAATKLRDWRAQRQALQAELDAQKRALSRSGEDMETQVDKALERLATLQTRLTAAKPAQLREVIRQAISRIECWFDTVPFGPKRRRGRLSRGLIHVRPDAVIFKDLTSARSRV